MEGKKADAAIVMWQLRGLVSILRHVPEVFKVIYQLKDKKSKFAACHLIWRKHDTAILDKELCCTDPIIKDLDMLIALPKQGNTEPCRLDGLIMEKDRRCAAHGSHL